MTLEEHATTLQALQNETDASKKAEIVLKLSNDYRETQLTLDKTTSDLKQSQEQCTRYATLNNELFLQSQSVKSQDANNDTSNTTEHQAKLSYDNLKFDN